MSSSGTVCLDFDGVIHQYVSGWAGGGVILDPPVEGAFDFIEMLLINGYSVAIFSSRSRMHDGIPAMQRWLDKHGMSKALLDRIQFPKAKPPAILYIDDRGFHFEGTFPSLLFIQNFKPWNKKK